MKLGISIKTQNTLTEVEKIIRRVLEVHRKELCQSLKIRLANFESYHFRPSNCALVAPYHKVCDLYNNLCDTDKEEFKDSFPEIAHQFGA